jgi:hypothetical protein
MKTRIVAVLVCLSSTGCGSVFMLNVGSAAHEAVSVGKPLTPEVDCAALAQSGKHVWAYSSDAVEVCEQAVEEQKMIDEKKKKK